MSIAEQVLRSADEIVSSRLNEVHFDKTEIATVLSKVKNKENVYWLNNGSIKYEANVLNNSKYSNGAQVYVTIINGDYNQDKVIIGSYDNTNDDPVYLYEDPFNRFGINTTIPIDIDSSGNTEYQKDCNFSLTALGTPTYIGAKVSLETNIENSIQPYGFYIQLLANEKEKPDQILYETVIDSRHITGNPYKLFSNMFHSFVFTLPNNFLITDVKQIKLKFYQDEEVTVNWKNITLFLGYDLKSDIIVNSEKQVFAATDALHSYYNVQTGKKEQRFQGFNEFLPKDKITPKGEGKISSSSNNNWEFYSLATSENESPTTENEDSVEIQSSLWNDQRQEISSYLDWSENGPIKNIDIYHNVIRFKANSTFIAKKLKDLKNGQSYKIKFQYYVDPEALIKDSGYVQNIGIYKVDESVNVGKYFYDIPDNQRIKGKVEKLAAAAGEWHEYSIDFIYEDEYTYYFGFEPSFNTNAIQDYCCLYVDNFQLFETIIVQPKEILGSWVKDRQIYSKNNPYPSQILQETETIENNNDENASKELPEISLQWYQYSPNHKDEGMGVAWKKLDNETNWSLTISETNEEVITWKYVDTTKPEARFRLLVKYSDQEYKSNVLVLTNDGFQGAKSSVENGDLVLTLNDDGIYLYDHMAQLYADEEIEKILTASSRKGEDDLKPSNTIVWFIPKESTMIAPPTRQAKKKDNSDDVDYYYWDYYPEKHYSEEPQLEDFNDYVLEGRYTPRSLNSYYIIEKKCDDLSQNFKIKKTYQPNCVNNDIICYIYETDKDVSPREGYRTTFTPQFVSANNSGIEASLGIELVSDKGYFGGDNKEDLKLKGIVYDKNGQKIEEQPQIFFNNLNCYAFSELAEGWIETWENNVLNITHDGKNTGSSFFHFKINLQTISECLDERDSILGPISSITDYIVTLPNEITNYTLILRGDSPRDIEPQTFKNYDVQQVENNSSSNFNKWGQKITLRYYPKNYNDYSNVWPDSETKDDNKDNIVEYKIYYDVKTSICHIPYGSLLWFSIRANSTSTTDNNFNLTLEEASDGNNSFIINNEEIKFSSVIKAFCNWNSEITGTAVQLSTYYAIPYFPTDTTYYLDGATQISYSSFGDNPKPSRNIDYTLCSQNEKTQDIIASNNYYLEILEQDCPAKVENKWIEKEQAFRHRIIMPTLAPAEESIYTINVYNAFSTISDDKQILNKGDILLAQYPLILLRNTYAFKEISAWKSGTTEVRDNYVLSPMIGAGSKNEKNQFTGVIMGTSSEFPQTGLYGFQDGVATFGFKEDGSCFLGANEETGRIEFKPSNSGGEMIINAKINRISSLAFQETNYLYTNTNNTLFFGEKSFSFGTYLTDLNFTGMTFNSVAANTTSTYSKSITGYIGAYVGYWKGDNTAVPPRPPREQGMMIRNGSNSADSVLSITSKGLVEIISSNSNILSSNSASYGSNFTGSLITLLPTPNRGTDGIRIQSSGSIRLQGYGKTFDAFDTNYEIVLGEWDNVREQYFNRFEGVCVFNDNNIYFGGDDKKNDNFIQLVTDGSGSGTGFHFDFNNHHVYFKTDGMYYGAKRVVNFSVSV